MSTLKLFSNRITVLTVSLTLFFLNVYSQSSLSGISEFKINQNQPVAPGNIVASCVVNEGGDIPYKRYALIYTNFEAGSINLLLEKTVVQWGGWSWSEVAWFSPVVERKSCKVSQVNPECRVNLVLKAAVKLKLADSLGNIIIEKIGE